MDPAELLTDPEDEQSAALIEALRKMQERQQAERAGLQGNLERQQGQAGGLRALSLLTSLGDNPLLRGIQRAAGEQGGQMEGLAARTESRLAGSGGNLLDAIRLQQGQQRLKQAAEAMRAQEGRFQRTQAQSAEQQGLNRASRERSAAILAGAKDTDTTEKQTKEFGEEVVKSGAPGFYSRLDEAQTLLERHKADIPGFGRLEGRLPDEAISDDGRALRQAVGQLLSEYRKGQSGAGMSDSERTEYGRITGLLQTGDEKSLRQGVEMLRTAFDERVRATAGGYRPDAVKAYTTRVPRIGSVLNLDEPVPHAAPAPAKQAPAASKGGKVHVSNGKENFYIDPADVEEAKADGFKVVP